LTIEQQLEKTIDELLKSAKYKSSDEQSKRDMIGEEIYSYIESKSSQDDAGKITGMIIDLPIDALETSVKTIISLSEKISEGKQLLAED